MSNIMGMVSFRLKEGVSESDFLLAHEKYNKEVVSKQKGYVFHKLLFDGDKWSDLVVWETMEDVHATFEAVQTDPIAIGIMDLIDQIGGDEDIPLFTVVKSYTTE